MPDLNRVVAGLRCRDVLEDLSELLDGALPPERVAAIHAHLAECETCARFGGTVGEIVATLRTHAPVAPLEEGRLHGLLERVRARVAETT
jgi:anti-sigma factor RsiW